MITSELHRNDVVLVNALIVSDRLNTNQWNKTFRVVQRGSVVEFVPWKSAAVLTHF